MSNKIMFLILCLFLVSGMANAIDLPRTGQTVCMNPIGPISCKNTGQDADILAGLAWPNPRFASSGGTLTDRLTGLIWLKDANCFGTDYFPDALANVGALHQGVCGLSDSSARGDWRLPNLNELHSLLNASDLTTTWLIDQGFTNVQSDYYFASTTYAADTTKVWQVRIASGYMYPYNKLTGKAFALAVRGTSTGPAEVWRTGQITTYEVGDDGDIQAGAVWPAPRFIDNGDGTVTDRLTSLVWLRDADCFAGRSWPNALSDANSLRNGLCGLTDGSSTGEWHLPNRVELRSLLDYENTLPALPTGHPFVNVKNTGYWTSTYYNTGDSPYYFAMSYGTLYTISYDTLLRVWPVRSGGNAGPVPDITVTDSTAPPDDLEVNFGDVTEMTTADETVTITNDGTADLAIGNIAQANPLASSFSILNDNCSLQVLTPLSNCTFTLRFSPDAISSYLDSFDIPSNDTDENPVTMLVRGNGIGVPTPDISVSDAVAPVDDLQVPFGNVTEMTTADQIITITNVGNAYLNIDNIATANPLDSPFSLQADNCTSAALAPAGSCTLTVRFAPTGTGAFSDSFDIPSDDPDEGSVTVSVSGIGTPTPVADITVTDAIAPMDDLQLPFADLTVDGISDQTVTIGNDGNANLIIGNIAQDNVLTAPFSIENDSCSGQTVPAASNCSFVVRFAPIAAGTFNDSFDIPSDDPDEASITVNVSGTGLAAAANHPPLRPEIVSPADGQQGLATTVVLEWKPVTDPDGDTVTYDIHHCTDTDPLINCLPLAQVASFDTGLRQGTVYASLGLGGGVIILGITFVGGMRSKKHTVLLLTTLIIGALASSCGGGDDAPPPDINNNKTYSVSGLAVNTTYYWSIVARDGNGGETASAVRSYTTAP